MRVCESCGGSMTGKRSHARFCSDLCRVRAHKGHPLVAQPVEPEALPAPEGLMTREELASVLQRDLRSTRTPATAKPALAREYRAVLTEIEDAKPPEMDRVRELFESRA